MHFYYIYQSGKVRQYSNDNYVLGECYIRSWGTGLSLSIKRIVYVVCTLLKVIVSLETNFILLELTF